MVRSRELRLIGAKNRHSAHFMHSVARRGMPDDSADCMQISYKLCALPVYCNGLSGARDDLPCARDDLSVD